MRHPQKRLDGSRTRAQISPALLQGAMYVATGLWPIVHLRSFETVTGPKVDDWLVKTTGGLIAAVGVALLVGAIADRRSPALAALGTGSAAALCLADLIYSGKGRISRIYLADAAAELVILAGWAMHVRTHRIDSSRLVGLPSARAR